MLALRRDLSAQQSEAAKCGGASADEEEGVLALPAVQTQRQNPQCPSSEESHSPEVPLLEDGRAPFGGGKGTLLRGACAPSREQSAGIAQECPEVVAGQRSE